jgi:hypothetical protein
VATKRTLQPNETATIDVTLDGRRFVGPKSAAIYVTVSHTHGVSTTPLIVTANVRADVVCNPKEVDFGTVRVGQERIQTVDVDYAGPLPWKVTEAVVPNGAPFEATVKELYRQSGQVGYRVTVTLKSCAAPGFYRDNLLIRTNQATDNPFPLSVSAEIKAPPAAVPAKQRRK